MSHLALAQVADRDAGVAVVTEQRTAATGDVDDVDVLAFDRS
jgi:hypothetical protein